MFQKRKKMLKSLQLFIFSLTFASISAQIGGNYTYEFLGLPNSARETALGGSLITVADDDVNLALANPALLSDKTNRSLAFNHNFIFDGISSGYFSYGFQSFGLNSHAGIKYVNYGDFIGADPLGNQTGTFSANELAIHIGSSKVINEAFTVGVNIKAISSTLESYNSFGMATDIGVLYHKPEANYQLAFTIKNIGGELSTFTDTRQQAPLDIQIAYSKKLTHLPFRFSITLHQLQQWSIRYDDPNAVQETDLFGETSEESELKKEVDNLFRHIIFSGEFLLGRSQNLRLRLGYNHFRRQELSVSDFRSLSGFSTGFGLKINRFRIDYGVGYHHLAGATNQLTISTNLHRFGKKL